MLQSSSAENQLEPIKTFRISPLIRFTLLGLYLGLTLPLPFLAQVQHSSLPPWLICLGIGLGFVVLYGALSEQVVLSQQGLHVRYPVWVPSLLRKGWFLRWEDVQALKPVSTGQGGLVYYFTTKTGQAYLLPMRMAGFAEFVRQVEAKTGIDTTDVRPLSQPWMYLILLIFTVMLLALDGWAIWTALTGLDLG